MHPNPAFAWTDRDEMLAFLAAASFSTIIAVGSDQPALVHAPVAVGGKDRVRFHISKNNRAVAAFESGRALLSCVGPHVYVSPDWYGTDDQVPTWNYVAVECEGAVSRMADEALPSLLDDLSAAQERLLLPKPAWTRDKMSPDRWKAMLRAIVGFEMGIETIRGTRKLGQHKREAERAGAAAGVEKAGNPEMAALMRAAT